MFSLAIHSTFHSLLRHAMSLIRLIRIFGRPEEIRQQWGKQKKKKIWSFLRATTAAQVFTFFSPCYAHTHLRRVYMWPFYYIMTQIYESIEENTFNAEKNNTYSALRGTKEDTYSEYCASIIAQGKCIKRQSVFFYRQFDTTWVYRISPAERHETWMENL